MKTMLIAVLAARVLFVGNSYTAINDLPKLVESLSGSAIKTGFVGEGGATLKSHWEKGVAVKEIRSGKWDYVVLQEQGTLGQSRDFQSINDPAIFFDYARRFDEEIRKSGAKTVLFETWARQHRPQDQEVLTNAYARIGRELGAIVAPVGTAWQKALRENPNVALHHADRSHPSLAGSKLAASVLYAVLSGRTPDDGSRAIFEKAQKAAGGRDRLRSMKDMAAISAGTIHTPQGEMKFTGRDAIIFPATFRSEQVFPFGEIITFFDGGEGWHKTPKGVAELPDRLRDVLRAQIARNTYNILREETPTQVELVKREGNIAVLNVKSSGESATLHIDTATGAIVRKIYAGIGSGGPAELEETYSDFRDVSGIQIPFRTTIKQNGAPFIDVTIESATVDRSLRRAAMATKPE